MNFRKLLLTAAFPAILGISSCRESSNSCNSCESKMKPFNFTFSGVEFSDVINGADSLITLESEGRLALRAKGMQDYFRDQEGKNNKAESPILLKKIDNSKPFSFSAKVTPVFTEAGMFNAGVVFIYASDSLWHKSCFEQDFKGNKRFITVQTEGTSDDGAHDIINQPYVYMKIVSNTKVVISYYSLDGQNWERARIYKNNFPKDSWIGLSTQCPRDTAGCVSYFEELAFSEAIPENLRLGV